VCAALLGTFPFWLPKKEGTKKVLEPVRPQSSPTPRWFWMGMAVITLAGVWERHPRMDHSLWNDEEYSLRSYTNGEWVHKGDEGDEVTFKRIPWGKTLFANEHGNNHLFTAAASRISLNLWQTFSGAAEEKFSETALRMPSYVSSLVAILVVGWLGLQLGGPAVGLTAAALLAISPWHIRYSGESKGYATMIAFMTVHLAAAIQVARTRRTGWWLVFTLTQAGYLLCFAGSLYVALCINAMLALECLLQRDGRRFRELTAFNLVGAVPVMWWMFPTIPQVMAYLTDDKSPRLDMGWPWVRDLLSGWAIGWGHGNPLPALHYGTSWVQEIADASWAWKLLFMGVLPVLGVAGFAVAWKRKPVAVHLGITAMTLAAALAYTHTAVKHSPMWVWYLIYTVIPMVLMLPLAIQWLTRCCEKAGMVLMALLVVGLTSATWGSTQRIRLHDRQPTRETAAYIRGQSPDALTGTFGVSDRQAESYDPPVHVLETLQDLTELMARAGQEKRPLYVYLCGESITSGRHPEMYQRVKHSGEFEEVQYLPGTEEMFSYRVFRAR
ncbi:MAG: hypothetical protein ACAI34_25560, partial [Verrucomicrobium sp.]